MKLRGKFNVMLVLVFGLGIGVSGYLSNQQLSENARQEVLHNAGILMETILSVRNWAVNDVGPNLRETDENEFLMQGVPPYAAKKVMEGVLKRYPDYGYREVALNPTNPKDRPAEWEKKIVDQFRSDPNFKEASGIRQTPQGSFLYLARPIQIGQSGCLGCHSTPEKAPPQLVKEYGPEYGYGWKLKEIVGAQFVMVPIAVPVANAERMFETFMTALVGVFVALFILLNIMMTIMVTRPLAKMAGAADDISRGNMSIGEFDEKGSDEVADLSASFNRMRRSLVKAMDLFNRNTDSA